MSITTSVLCTIRSWLTCPLTPACCFLLLTSSDTWILSSPFIIWKKNIQTFPFLQFRKKTKLTNINIITPTNKCLRSREDGLELIFNIPLSSYMSGIKTCLFSVGSWQPTEYLVIKGKQKWISKCIKNCMNASYIYNNTDIIIHHTKLEEAP